MLAALLVLVLAQVGCSEATLSSADTTSSSDTLAPSYSPSTLPSSTTTTTSSATTAPSLLSPTEKELAETARIEHSYAVYLSNEHAPEDDPRMAALFGLRARIQALTCLGALSGGNMELADTAMLNVYRSLNRGQAVATESVATLLAEARSVIAEVGAPSDHPEEAKRSLEHFVEKLAPLVDEVAGLLNTTTTTG